MKHDDMDLLDLAQVETAVASGKAFWLLCMPGQHSPIVAICASCGGVIREAITPRTTLEWESNTDA